jgi:hypothetical protein
METLRAALGKFISNAPDQITLYQAAAFRPRENKGLHSPQSPIKADEPRRKASLRQKASAEYQTENPGKKNERQIREADGTQTRGQKGKSGRRPRERCPGRNV